MDIIDFYRVLNPITIQNTFFSATLVLYTKQIIF
jgi:hypothetical protein